MIQNVLPTHASIGHYIPTWSNVTPHMPTGHAANVVPRTHPGLLSDVAALCQQLTTVEWGVSAQPQPGGALQAPNAA